MSLPKSIFFGCCLLFGAASAIVSADETSVNGLPLGLETPNSFPTLSDPRYQEETPQFIVGENDQSVIRGANPSDAPPANASLVKRSFTVGGIYSLCWLAFCLLAMAMLLVYSYLSKYNLGVQATRFFGLAIITMASVFLITAGYGPEQIAPAIGLLGTIAGYLLGKAETK